MSDDPKRPEPPRDEKYPGQAIPEHSDEPRHEHKSEESWSTPRWGPLLDEHDTGVDKE